MVNAEIDKEKMEEILNAVKGRIEKVTPIRLYLEDQSDEGISFGAFMKTLAFHFSHGKDLEKIAIVTDDTVFHNSMEMKDVFVPARVQSFDRKERLKAMNWVIE